MNTHIEAAYMQKQFDFDGPGFPVLETFTDKLHACGVEYGSGWPDRFGKALEEWAKVTVQTWWVELGESRLIDTCLGVRNGDSPPIFDLQTLGSPQV